MKPTLFIDFDGTLCHDRFWKSLPIESLQRIQKFLFQEQKEIVLDWMRGKYTSEEVNNIVAKELGMQYTGLWDVFVSDCAHFVIDQTVLEKILKLREHYLVVLITDNMDSLERFTAPSKNLDCFFDQIVNSYNLGKFKNDDGGMEYLRIVKENDSNISQSVLIDDSENSMRTFENLGGKALRATKEMPLSLWLDTLQKE